MCIDLATADCSPLTSFDVDGLGTVHEVEAGRHLITEGHPTSRFVLLLEGSVLISERGIELVRRAAGDYCGEIGLLDRLSGGPGIATATVVTCERSLVHSLAPWEFKRLLDRDPTVRRCIIEQARKRLRRLD